MNKNPLWTKEQRRSCHSRNKQNLVFSCKFQWELFSWECKLPFSLHPELNPWPQIDSLSEFMDQCTLSFDKINVQNSLLVQSATAVRHARNEQNRSFLMTSFSESFAADSSTTFLFAVLRPAASLSSTLSGCSPDQRPCVVWTPCSHEHKGKLPYVLVTLLTFFPAVAEKNTVRL